MLILQTATLLQNLSKTHRMDAPRPDQYAAEVLRDGFRIAEWHVEPKLHRITGPDGVVRVPPRAMDVLVCLAEQAGEVVTREALLARVWGEVIVSEDALTRCIADLRKLFGEDAKAPRLIETIRMGGYRLLRPVQPLESHPLVLHNNDRRHAARLPKRLGLGASGIAMLCLVGIFGFYLGQPAAPQAAVPYRAVPLTSYEGIEFDVAISPDGEKVVFGGVLEDPRQIEIYMKQIGAASPLRLTNDPGIEISPAWSPGGQAIAFIRGRNGDSCGVFMLEVPGGDERKLVDCHELNVTGVSFSPDGKTVVYSDRQQPNQPFQILRVDLETLVVDTLTTPPHGLFGDFSASFSPDGKTLAFLRGTVPSTVAVYLAPALADVHTLDLQTGHEQRLTFDNQEIPHLDWSADGQHLLFASNRERGSYGLWKIPASGGEAMWVMGGQGLYRKPAVARGAKRMVFEQWQNDTDLWQRSVWDTTTAAEPLIASTHWESNPDYSPDGEHLAFVSRRSGATEVWISAADGTRAMQVTQLKGDYVANPRWSPDGKHIAFERHVDGQADIFVVDARGGQVEQVTAHAANDMVPSWSHDGNALYFGSNRTGTWQVWRTALDEAQPERITPNGGYLAQESDDGRLLYYSHLDASGIWRIALDGPSERSAAVEVVEGLPHYDWGSWDLGAAGVYYVERQPTRLVYRRFNTEETQYLGRIPRLSLGVASLSVSPDEAQVIFSHQLPLQADLWVVDGFDCCR